MPDKSEKERRRIVAKELRQKAKEKFEESLPLPKETFQKLFDFLDEKLSENNCDDTLKFATEFLEDNNILHSDDVIEWLKGNGGFCDCEVLNNVEEMFSDDAIL